MLGKLFAFLKDNFCSIGGLLAFCMFSTIAYIPFDIPLPLMWMFMGICGIKILAKKAKFGYAHMIFLIWCIASVIFAQPDPLFKSDMRLANFVLLSMCVSPLVQGEKAVKSKVQIFNTFITLSIVYSVISFFAYFLGINKMVSNADGDEMAIYNTAGVFGGLFYHSMLLGPVASVSCVVCLYKYLISNSRTYAIFAWICLGSVMFSASRSAFLSLIASCFVVFVIIGHARNSFLKYITRLIIVFLLSLPFVLSNSRLLQQKQDSNVESGGMFESRREKFDARKYEIEKSPLYGVGFAAIDIDTGDDYVPDTGTIEPGSSWLCVMSMTGVVGFLMFCGVIATAIKRHVFSHSSSKALPLGLITFFLLHLLVEGYVLAAGSALCFLFWMVIGFYDKTADISVFTKQIDEL